MSKFLSHFDKTYFLLVPVVLYTTWPWLTYRLRPIIPFLLFCLWFVFQRNPNWNFFQKRIFLQLGAITLVFFVFNSCLRNIFALVNHGQFFTYGELGTFLSAIIHFSIVHLSFSRMKFKEVEFLMFVALIGMMFAGIAAVRGGMIEGFEGGRLITTSDEFLTSSQSDDKLLAYQIGAASYGMTYNFSMITVPLLWSIFTIKKRYIQLLLIAALGSCVLIIRNSGLGTPVIVLILGFVLFLCTIIGLKGWGIKLVGSMAIILLITFSYNPNLFSPLSSAANMLGSMFPEDSSIQARCKSMAEAFGGDVNTYAYNRYQLQRKSLNAFFEHPIFGAGLYRHPHHKSFAIGGHSHLLDRLGQAGIIGGFFYFGFLVFLSQYYRQMTICFGLPRKWLVVPLICIFTYVFTCIANPLPTYPVLLYYMPGLPLLALKYDLRNRNSGQGYRICES